MKNILYRFNILFKAINELGFNKVLLFAIYKLICNLRIYYILTPFKSRSLTKEIPLTGTDLNIFPNDFQTREKLLKIIGNNINIIRSEASEIINGDSCYFGNYYDKINLSPENDRKIHWSLVSDKENDIKLIWESARFGWAFTLARAYVIFNDETYTDSFWKLFETFQKENPINIGPNWVSAQEIALRILAFSFALDIFKDSIHSTATRINSLYKAIWEHANRIPLTLLYSKSQNNNHILSEAVGLFTAGIIFKNTKKGQRWKSIGHKVFHSAIQDQISSNGTYIQNSTNYHRLMLQLSIWMYKLSSLENIDFPSVSYKKLSLATQWLLSLTDFKSGNVCNLGHNDGSNIFPLSTCSYSDFKPTLQAASEVFLNKHYFSQGPWNEFAFWFDIDTSSPLKQFEFDAIDLSKHRLGNNNTWGYLRAVNYTDRPAHCDQLHVDLWWKGFNIALDPGTYRYTHHGIWKNALASTHAHNTVLVNEQDQMTKAGRFLWLDWAKTKNIISTNKNTLSAEHDGYVSSGIVHRRSLSFVNENQWEIIDEMIRIHADKNTNRFSLHWLLPDLPYELSDDSITLKSKFGDIKIKVIISSPNNQSKDTSVQLIHAGNLIHGTGEYPKTLGWYSPTYNVKIPSLSYRIIHSCNQSLNFSTLWTLNNK